MLAINDYELFACRGSNETRVSLFYTAFNNGVERERKRSVFSLLAVFVLCMVSFVVGSAQVTILTNYPKTGTRSVDLIDAAHIYSVMGNNSVSQSIDSGRTWKVLEIDGFQPGGPAFFSQIRLDSNGRGWLIGQGAALWTSDSCKTWRQAGSVGEDSTVSHLTMSELKDVCFFNDSLVWICGEMRYIIYSKDTGRTWLSSPQLTESGDGIFRVQFVSPTHGWVLTRNYELLETSDGGVSWSDANAKPKMLEFCFVDDSVGWAGGQEGIYKSTNGGHTWNQQKQILQGCSTVVAIDRRHVWGAYNNTLFSSHDGGETWSTLSISPLKSMNRLVAADSTTVYGTGQAWAVRFGNGGRPDTTTSVSFESFSSGTLSLSVTTNNVVRVSRKNASCGSLSDIAMFNGLGLQQQIHVQWLDDSTAEIRLPDLTNGIYFVALSCNNRVNVEGVLVVR